MDGIRDAEVSTRLVEMQSCPDGPVDCLATASIRLLDSETAESGDRWAGRVAGRNALPVIAQA